jgi:hypothetical protein
LLLDNSLKYFFQEISYSIYGYAKCQWYEEKGAGSTIRADSNRAREDFINKTFTFLEPSESESLIDLEAGDNKFNLSYSLSENLPTSFKSKNGSIKYKILVLVEKPRKSDSTFEFPFTVIRPLNLNNPEYFYVRSSAKEELSKNFKMDFTSEPLYMSAFIPFRGYVPGQTINIKINVNNQSKTHVKEIKISFKKIVVFNSAKPKKKTKILVLSEAKVSTDAIPILSMESFDEKLVVPSLPPNITNCDVIQVSYELRVKAMTSGLSRSPKLKIPITIGTVPLEGIRPSPSCSLREYFFQIS